MNWQSVRNAYPDQWLIIEALEAHTTADHRREIKSISVVEQCIDGVQALARYRALHAQFPEREYYYVHTRRGDLDIQEVIWSGIRRSNAAYSER